MNLRKVELRKLYKYQDVFAVKMIVLGTTGTHPTQ